MEWVLVSIEYPFFQSSVGLTGNVVVLKHWVTDEKALHLVTRESELCGRKIELLKVLMRIKRGRENRILSSRVASIEKYRATSVRRVLWTS